MFFLAAKGCAMRMMSARLVFGVLVWCLLMCWNVQPAMSQPIAGEQEIQTVVSARQSLDQFFVNPGESLTLSVGLNRLDGASFQWIKGVGRSAQFISGGTSQNLVVGPAQVSDEGVYMALITTQTGRISTSLSRVLVNRPVEITQSPSSQSVMPGAPVLFVVKATGTGPFTYQWMHDGVPIPNATQ